ncbi:hypothetical protein CPAST_c34620 [Clostridium pasteurianum DSM 525 = ATCC 6013]|uniref:Uncharacterized protein n=1 Tax=Clostridium pasteurianum DSM 525 = ATCC 6013 TaxID=1262449 RepID=A0A0H3JAG3_CLOPA|nr:hypothetical protein CPAST_c34620 [Clostridium pasteurianum DSM 525 = ATCC 6013]AJA53511.1 hypothetical protein CLPA_c34620 [Clostridium pasteurianum DSM 525 = ATCC 6013]KRU14464.1 hypothetical protein CP6013_03722 [Clostridium pasteurianum DSM 525 = ATCC 6013]
MVKLNLFVKSLYKYTNNKFIIKTINYISLKLDKKILKY